MAAKRMFNCRLLRSDKFTSLSHAAQSLYVQINLSADDDGFCNEHRSIMKSLRVRENALNELIQNDYVLEVSKGVLVVKHWNVHNTLKTDRYNGTMHSREKESLVLDSNKVYQYKKYEPPVNLVDSLDLEPQFSIDKVIQSIDYSSTAKQSLSIEQDEKLGYGKHKNVFLTQKQVQDFLGRKHLIDHLSEYLYIRKISTEDAYQDLITWVEADYNKVKAQRIGNENDIKIS